MGHDLQTEWLNSQLVSTGVLCRKAPLSICLTRKSATSAREMNPHVQLCGSSKARYAFVLGPLVRITGRTITQSSLLLRTMRSCTSFVVIDAPQHQMESNVIKKPATAA